MPCPVRFEPSPRKTPSTCTFRVVGHLFACAFSVVALGLVSIAIVVLAILLVALAVAFIALCVAFVAGVAAIAIFVSFRFAARLVLRIDLIRVNSFALRPF